MVRIAENHVISENSLFGFYKVAISPDGNLTQDGRCTYAWDAENRLSKVERSESLKVEFKYDYMGRRVERKVFPWDSNTNAYYIENLRRNDIVSLDKKWQEH